MRSDGYLLYDGCWLDRSLSWHYTNLPDHEPFPILLGTDYHTLAELGPVMVPAKVGDAADLLWRNPDSPIHNGVWLESKLSPLAILSFIQSRLQVSDSHKQSYWVRLADSRPLRRVFDSSKHWPDGFWDGIDAVWLSNGKNPLEAWRACPKLLETTSTDKGPGCLSSVFTLGQEILNSLAGIEEELG